MALPRPVGQPQPENFAGRRRWRAVDKGGKVVARVNFEASGNWRGMRLDSRRRSARAPVELQSAGGATETGAKNLREGVEEG